jgi:hypothetical protein
MAACLFCRGKDSWPLIFLSELGDILKVKQPTGKAGEVLDGKLAGNIVYGVCVACYESLASNLLVSNAVALDHDHRCGSPFLSRLR